VNEELERIYKEGSMIIFQYLVGESEEKHENIQSQYLMSRPRFKAGTSPIQSRSDDHTTIMMSHKAMVIPTLLCGSENWVMKQKDLLT
jgi:hypothetical protein